MVLQNRCVQGHELKNNNQQHARLPWISRTVHFLTIWLLYGYASELGTADHYHGISALVGRAVGQDPMHPVGYVSAGAHEGKAAASLLEILEIEGENCREEENELTELMSDTRYRLPPLYDPVNFTSLHHSACQLKLIKEFCTDLDFLGVNSYGEDGICKHIVFTSNLLVWKHPNQPAKIIYTSLLFKSSVFSSKMMQHG